MRSKKRGKSLFRVVNDWLHLWLGLASGIIVFIVSITGCIYAYQKEISSITQPYQFVPTESKPYLPPSVLKKIAEQKLFGDLAGKPEKSLTNVFYAGAGKASIAAYRDKKTGYMMVYQNPYSGEVLKIKALEKDFFRIMLMGHFQLWLPRDIGQPIVAWGTLIFVVLLITGLIMWWPKNLRKANRDKSFKVKWKATFKRVNYDLHNVLGFYALMGALIIAITGLYFGFKWVPKSIYYVASGGKKMPELRGLVSSDTTAMPKQMALFSAEDSVWSRLTKEHGGKGSLSISFAQKRGDAISTSFNPDEATYYRTVTRYFDRYSLAEIKGHTLFNKKFEEGSGAEQLLRMNYDIHIGAIGGIAGKTLAFLISLVCASLPVTGFIIWWGKKKKTSKKGRASAAAKRTGTVSKTNSATVVAAKEPVDS